MTAVFPAAPLGATAEMYLGAWTDVSAYVLQRDGSSPISVTRGRPDQSSQMNPSQASLQMKNPDGRFTIMNPMGAYYGQLTRNTPLRLSLPNSVLPAPYNTTYLRMEDDAVSYASCPAASIIELSGSIDVRLDIDLSGYGFLPLAGIWGASATVNQRCWMFGLNSDGTLFLSWTTDGTMATLQSAPSDTRSPLPLGRLVVRVVLNATNGNVTFYTAPAGTIDTGPWTQLGPVSTGPGTTVFTSSSAPLQIGYSPGYSYDYNPQVIDVDFDLIAPQGAIYDMELHNAAGGGVVAHPAFSVQAAGTTSWTDTHGNTWSLTGTAELSDRVYRFHGEMTELPKASDPSATDVYVSAVASGVTRRLQQAQSPLNSPFYRNYVRITGPGAPVAYWPCEDASGSTQIASAVSGGRAMHISGTPQLASNSTFVCSESLPAVNGSIWTGAVVAPSTSWSAGSIIGMLVLAPSSGDTGNAVIARIATTSPTVPRIDVVYGSANGGQIALAAYGPTGTAINSVLVTAIINGVSSYQNFNGVPLYMAVSLVPSGSNLNLIAYAMTPGGPTMESDTVGLGAGTVGAVTSVTVNPLGPAASGGLSQTVVGHIAVHAAGAYTWDIADPLNAWGGEQAAARYQRLCTEEGITSRIYGHKLNSAPMGYQTIQTLPDLLQECETTDRGMQYEPRTTLGLAYRPLSAFYNQSPRATASYTAASLDPEIAPTSDDQLSLNDVTVTNSDGSSARQILTSGPMSIQPPPAGISRIDTSIQVNAQADSQLASIAGWILHTGTDPYDRIPVLPFNMARTEVPPAVALLDVGDYLQITSPPAWIQYDTIDQLGAGYSEKFGPAGVWSIDVNGIPERSYLIAQVAGGTGLATHADTDGSTLTAAVSASATSMQFTTTAAGMPAWTYRPVDFPFDVDIAGERITVVGPGSCQGPDPFMQQGLAQYITQNGTLSLSTANYWPNGLQSPNQYCTGTALATPSGSGSYCDVVQNQGAPGAVTAGVSYTVWGWVYATVARTYQAFMNFFSSTGYIGTADGGPVSVPAGVWTLVTGTVTAGSGATSGQGGIVDGNTPTSADTFQVFGINWAPTASITSSSPQTMTVQRSINGVVKAQAAGVAVSLWFPPIVGL